MSSITLPSITGVDIELRVAGPGSRSYAFVIDWHIRLILALAWFFATVMVYGGTASLFEGMEGIGENFWYVATFPSAAIYLFYHPILEVLMHGRTPGKRMAGVRVVSRSGDIPSVGALLLRNVFRIVDSMPAFYLIGLCVVMFTAQHVRIGDMAAGTLLVIDDEEHDRSLTQLASVAHARTLNPRAAELVQELLDRWKSLDDATRANIARSLLARLDPDTPAATLVSQDPAELRARLEALLAPKEPA